VEVSRVALVRSDEDFCEFSGSPFDINDCEGEIKVNGAI
jgi:hypothetical protein